MDRPDAGEVPRLRLRVGRGGVPAVRDDPPPGPGDLPEVREDVLEPDRRVRRVRGGREQGPRRRGGGGREGVRPRPGDGPADRAAPHGAGLPGLRGRDQARAPGVRGPPRPPPHHLPPQPPPQRRSRKTLRQRAAPAAPKRQDRTRCLACRAVVPESETTCPACGAALGPEAEQAYMEKTLAGVRGSLEVLSEDPDFQSMPEAVRREILSAMEGMLQGPEATEDDEYTRQIEAWREKGFDVEPVILLLAQHPSNFRERAVRIIRAQIRKKMEGGMFKCPLCEERLESTAEECGNCGAKFA